MQAATKARFLYETLLDTATPSTNDILMHDGSKWAVTAWDSLSADILSLTLTPVNYTPRVDTPAQDANDVAAHIYGIDDELGDLADALAALSPPEFEDMAGEDIDEFETCYQKSDGKWYLAKTGGTEAERLPQAMCVESGGILANNSGTFKKFGFITNGSWSWTPGAQLFLSSTYGALTQDDTGVTAGYAHTATLIWFEFVGSPAPLEVDEGDLLVGNSSGTWETLPAGTEGYVLAISSGVPAWIAGGGGGEANTASNLGGGVGVYEQKVGVDLQFNTLGSAEFSESSNVISVNTIAEAKITFHTSTGHTHNGSDSTPVAGLKETGGQFMSMGAVSDGQYLKRSGTNIVGDSGTGTSGDIFHVVGGSLERASDTSLKWAFRRSNQIVLWNSGTPAWELVEVASEPTKANTDNDMGSNAITYDLIYDVFGKYSSGTAFTLEFAKWATDSARYSAWASSTNYYIGDRVSESGSYYACLENHTSGTFATDLAAGKWGEVTGAGDFLALGIKNGTAVYAESGAWVGYRWLGCVRLENDSGAVFRDNNNFRGIDDIHETGRRVVTAYNTTSNWSYTVTAWREADAGAGQTRGYFLNAITRSLSAISIVQSCPGSTSSARAGIGYDTTSAVSGGSGYSGSSGLYFELTGAFATDSTPGWHYLTNVEYGHANNPGFYGNDGVQQLCYLEGEIG